MSSKGRSGSGSRSRSRSGSRSGGNSNITPTYTSDSSNGYIQNTNGTLFLGKTVDLSFGNINRAYVIMHNPVDSSVNVIINEIDASNLSNVPIRINMYTGAKIAVKGKIVESEDVSSGNSGYSDVISEGSIYYGRGIKILDGTNVNTMSVDDYNTSVMSIGGSIILTPGNTLVLELSSLCDNQKAKGIISVKWWEE